MVLQPLYQDRGFHVSQSSLLAVLEAESRQRLTERELNRLGAGVRAGLYLVRYFDLVSDTWRPVRRYAR